MLPTDPEMDGVLEYLGGVLNFEPGVGGAELAGSPSSFLCPGVRGMSDMSSFFLNKGNSATPTLMTGINCRMNHIHPGCRIRAFSMMLEVDLAG